MSKKQNKNIITYDMQNKANEIINEGERTSLESKRINFQNYIKEYYNNFTGSSDILVKRYHDIDFYASTLKDILSSMLIGILTSTIVTLVFSYIDEEINIHIFWKIVIYIIIYILIIVLIIKFILEILNMRNKLYNYEKLHCEKFEKEIIERILDERLKQAEKTLSEKH